MSNADMVIEKRTIDPALAIILWHAENLKLVKVSAHVDTFSQMRLEPLPQKLKSLYERQKTNFITEIALEYSEVIYVCRLLNFHLRYAEKLYGETDFN